MVLHHELVNLFVDRLAQDPGVLVFPEIGLDLAVQDKSGTIISGVWHSCRADIVMFYRDLSRPNTTIYDIKVSKADFLSDVKKAKYSQYFSHCRRFFFAVPKGMLHKVDLPEDVGCVCWDFDKGTSYTLKAAPCRAYELRLDMVWSCLCQMSCHPWKERRRLDALKQSAILERDNLRSIRVNKMVRELVERESDLRWLLSSFLKAVGEIIGIEDVHLLAEDASKIDLDTVACVLRRKLGQSSMLLSPAAQEGLRAIAGMLNRVAYSGDLTQNDVDRFLKVVRQRE